jgi:hypothetical protein
MSKYALNLAEDNRILSVTYAKYASKNCVLVDELPEGNTADYLYVDSEYVYSPLPKPNYEVQEEIASLKAELASTDYKIIKCSEAQLVGEELPYDIATLHAERQALRDRINELEGGAE